MREEIADAAAELFSTQGFAGTSVSQIAKAVGVGQGSIYHHFGSKLGMLSDLLLEGVTPALSVAEALPTDENVDDEVVAARLFALALSDAATLAAWRWNIGALLLLPEARSKGLTEFNDKRRALRDHYVRLSSSVADRMGTTDHVDDLVLRLVVSIINQRWDGLVTEQTPRQIAVAGLRICGWSGQTGGVERIAASLLEEARSGGATIPAGLSAGRSAVEVLTAQEWAR